MPADDRERPARQGWRRLLPPNPWQLLIAPIIVGAVAAGVGVLTREDEPEKRVALKGLPPVVINPAEQVEPGAPIESGRQKGVRPGRQTEASKPRIEIRLHNTGTRRAVLTSAVFTVRRRSVFHPCGEGSGLLVSTRYDVTLPDREGASVEVPIDQQLGPDEADRFAFRVTAPGVLTRFQGDTLIYELDVGVRHDDDPAPLHVGRAVVAIPGTPEPSVKYSFPVAGGSACVETPPPEQIAPTTFTGARSSELDAFLEALRRAARGT
jgi:hypothetical protein